MLQEEIKRDIISVINESIKSLKRGNLERLREQSNRTVHNSSIYQDQYSISISVIIYTLVKIIEKCISERPCPVEKYKKTIILELKNSKEALIHDEYNDYSKSLKSIIYILRKLDKEAGRFISESLETSKVKKAYGLYRHGVSSGKAAELLGISKWELQTYLGATKESEEPLNLSKNVESRLKEAMEIFNVK